MFKAKKNCWETLGCGREEGGHMAKELGVCPAAQGNKYDGVNNGKYAGRFCWAIDNTFCNNCKQGTPEQKLKECVKCEHFQQIKEDEDRAFRLCPEDVERACEQPHSKLRDINK